jgi:hypothetical protein
MLPPSSPVYSSPTRPNVNRILANLIYFDSICSRKYQYEPTIKYTQDETTDEIVGPTGGQAVGHYRPFRNILVRVPGICFYFFRIRNSNRKIKSFQKLFEL